MAVSARVREAVYRAHTSAFRPTNGEIAAALGVPLCQVMRARTELMREGKIGRKGTPPRLGRFLGGCPARLPFRFRGAGVPINAGPYAEPGVPVAAVPYVEPDESDEPGEERPTPEEIAEECARIRQGWSAERLYRSAVCKGAVPVDGRWKGRKLAPKILFDDDREAG